MSRRARPPLIGVTGDLVERPRRRVQCGVRYLACIEEAGGIPVVLPPVSPGAGTDRLLDRLDGLVLTGGDDLSPASYGATGTPRGFEPLPPARERSELALAREARRRGMPLLGVCLGCQVLNVALGGTLLGDLRERLPSLHGHRSPRRGVYVRHPVKVAPGTLLREVLGTAQAVVPSRHHQAVDRVAKPLLPVAWSADGLVEGVEPARGGGFCLGVQWHPEADPGSTATRRLFRALIASAMRS